MQSSKKIKSLNVRIDSTLKHLRGRHDQRDHAWNRGMGGRSGGYAPGYMNQTEFQALKKNLQAQIEAGEITQEYGEAIWTTAQRLMQEDYDRANPRVGDELSRRESTIETLANRRRPTNAVPKKITASDISMNAIAGSLANLSNNTGRDFRLHFQNVGVVSAANATENEFNQLSETYLGLSTTPSSIFSSPEGKIAFEKFTKTLAYIGARPENPVSYETFIDLAQILSNKTGNTIESWQLNAAKLMSSIADTLRFTHSNYPNQIEEQVKNAVRRLNESLDMLNSLAESDYDTGNETENEDIKLQIEQAKQIIEYGLHAIHPSTLLAMYNFEKSKVSANAINSLYWNSFHDTGGIVKNDDILAFQNLITGNIEQDLKAIAGLHAFVMNDRDTPFYSRTNPSTENTQEAFRAMIANSEISDFFRKKFNLGDDQLVEPIYFFRSIFDTVNSNNAGLPTLSSIDGDMRKTVKLALFNDVALEIMEKIPDINFRGPVDNDKIIIRDIYKNFVQRINSVIRGQYGNLEIAEQNTLTLGAIDVATDGYWKSYISTDDMRQFFSEASISEGNDSIIADFDNAMNATRQQNQPQMSALDRLTSYRDDLLRRLDVAITDPYGDVESIERSLDDVDWDIFVEQNPDVNSFPLSRRLRLQLDRINFRNDEYRQQIQDEYDSERKKELEEVDYLFKNAVDFAGYGHSKERVDKAFSKYIDKFVSYYRQEGMSTQEVFDRIQNAAYLILDVNSDIDFAESNKVVQDRLLNRLDITARPFGVTTDEREALWGNKTPVLIKSSDVITTGQSTFESPSFAFGNPINNPLENNELMAPDDPNVTPSFNPRYARFAARDVIEKKDAVDLPLLDSNNQDQLRQALEAIGYPSDKADRIIGLLNDKLIPGPRRKNPVYRAAIYATPNGVKVELRYNVADDDKMQTTGGLDIQFAPESFSETSTIDNHIGIMTIPETTDDGDTNRYKGASAPFLMYSTDQMRKLAYEIGTPQAEWTADAVNIDQRGKNQSSGPTTWPVLGATAPVEVTTRLLSKLYNMGYSQEFIDYIKTRFNGKVPSYLFFLNAPPQTYVLREDPQTKLIKRVKVRTSQQALWSEIYDSGAVDESFPVRLNVASPNDPSRLINMMLPDAVRPSVEKNWISLKRVKTAIKNLKLM